MSPEYKPENPSDLTGIIEKIIPAEATAWVNSLPPVPSGAKPRIKALISRALADIREEHRPQK